MVRTFDGEYGGHNDCAKYTLTSYNEARKSGIFGKSADFSASYSWPGTNVGSVTQYARAGQHAGGSDRWYWCCVTFNYEELAELREKNVKNVKLEIEATLHEKVDIDMKKNAAGQNMVRCDKNGTSITKTKLGKWHSSSPNYFSRVGGVCTFDLTNDINGSFAGVPRYGYCWGRNRNATTSYGVDLIGGASPLTTGKRAKLYAVTNERQATLTFDAQGGSGAPASVTGVGPDAVCEVRIPAEQPTKSGMTFAGWSRTEGGSAAYRPGDAVTLNGDTTLYAVWNRLFVKARYLPGEGGTGSFEVISDAGASINIVDTSAFLSMPGKTLTGYSDTDGGELRYSFGDHYTLGYTDKTFYGVWETATYTVSYDANGGTGAPSPQTKTGGIPLTLSGTVPVRDGYDFSGWALTEDGEPVYQPGGTFNADADTTLYAVWTELGGLVRYASHEGVKTAKAYVMTEHGLLRAVAYVMTGDGLKEGQ